MNTISEKIESILTKQQLEKDYNELQSLTKIAEKYNISTTPIRAKFIEYGIPFKSKKHNHKCNYNIFSEESERSFYLAGFIAADGCIRISKTRKNSNYINHRLVIGVSKKDEDFLKLIRDTLESDHNFNYYTHKLSKYSNKWNDSESVKISITSEQMINDLKKFNIIPKKSLIYTFPEWLINHPLKNHFMRGYSDGDGSFYFNKNNKHISWSLRGTIDFLKVYKSIIEKECKFSSKAEPVLEDNIGNYRLHSNNFVSSVADFLYKDATIYLERKKIITEKGLK